MTTPWDRRRKNTVCGAQAMRLHSAAWTEARVRSLVATDSNEPASNQKLFFATLAWVSLTSISPAEP
jgi:hypothetical protein